MLKYTVKRLAQSLVTILLIATIVFLLMRCLPTDYYFTEEQLMKFTEEQKYAALEAAGLTDPIGTQLLHFYNDLLHLDFGTSRRIQNGASVVKVIGKKFGVSMRLGLISAGISLLVGIMLGILQTAFKDKVFDWIGTAYTVFVNAVPSLVSYSLVLVFGSKYLGFPTLYSTRNVGPSSVLPELQRDHVQARAAQRHGPHGAVYPPVHPADGRRLSADGAVLLRSRHGSPADRRHPAL